MVGEVLVARSAELATVTLSNPERLNALTLSMWQRLGDTFAELARDETLRCIVLRGAGDKAFAAGADIGEFAALRSNARQAALYGERIVAAMHAVRDCRHPTVAMIHGPCVGGGLEIASQCDLRICGASARFGVPIKNLGLVVGYDEMAGLIAVAGRAVALEMVLEGRVFGAEEALAKRLVTRVAPDDQLEAKAYAAARRIADGAPLVARWHKKFARRLAEARPLGEEERAESYACFDTEDFREGVAAFIARRKPAFRGR